MALWRSMPCASADVVIFMRLPHIPAVETMRNVVLMAFIAILSGTFVFAQTGAQNCVTIVQTAQMEAIDTPGMSTIVPSVVQENVDLCVQVYSVVAAMSLGASSLLTAVLGAALSNRSRAEPSTTHPRLSCGDRLWGPPPQNPKEAAERIRRNACKAIVTLLALGCIVVASKMWGLLTDSLLLVLVAILAFTTAMFALAISATASSYQLEFRDYRESQGEDD